MFRGLSVRPLRSPRLLLLGAGAAVVLIVLGCVTSPKPRGPLFEQKSELSLAVGAEKDVYFPKPYAAPPELTVTDDWQNDVRVVECQADHFRVRNEFAYQPVNVKWTAKGELPASAGPAPQP